MIRSRFTGILRLDYRGMTSPGPSSPISPLPRIPLLDLGAGGAPALLKAETERAHALLAAGRGRLPAALAHLADRISADWLARSGSPYLAETRAMAAHLGRPGVLFLNASYEWACTSGVGPGPSDAMAGEMADETAGETAGDGRAGIAGNRLIRVLDWPVPGLGRHLVAARHEGPAGAWINLTWPGFAGAIQGLAPGRFAAAINQAPMRRRGRPIAPDVDLGRPLDWALNRWRVWRRPALPPAHLLRRVFETCAGYARARRLLCETPIAMPTIFALCGPGPGETCVIERTETEAKVLAGPVAAANHWQGLPRSIARSDRPRGEDSLGRAAQMSAALPAIPGAETDFAWLKPPILNPTTRVAMAAEPAAGHLAARGYEAEGQATQTLRLSF